MGGGPTILLHLAWTKKNWKKMVGSNHRKATQNLSWDIMWGRRNKNLHSSVHLVTVRQADIQIDEEYE
jgi:hypothetical protein